MPTAISATRSVANSHARSPACRGLARRSARTAGALLLSLSVLVPAGAPQAAESVGAARRVVNQVTATSGNRKLTVADPVFRSESIAAAANSFGEIELNDGAKVLVGENSQVSLDDFVVAGDSFRKASIRVTKGAFRMISGNSHNAFNLRTPLANIGVRGTVFDVYVRDGGLTDVVLLRGRVDVCGRAGGCAVVDQPCDIVSVGADGRVTREPFLRSPERSRLEEIQRFPLLNLQWRFAPAYQAPVATCNGRAQLLHRQPEGDPEVEPHHNDD